MQRYAGEQLAPVWFTEAMERMDARFDSMDTRLDSMEVRLDSIEARQRNSSKSDNGDVIQPPMHGNANPPLQAPRTIAALKGITEEAIATVETYYELPHDGTREQRIKRLAKEYGVNLMYVFPPIVVQSI